MPKLDSANSSNSLKVSKGVYASLVTILEVTNLSNHPNVKVPLQTLKDGTPTELCIEVKYQKDNGEEWSQRFYGKYKIDEVTGSIKGWKAFGNGVQNFFETLLGKEILENTLNDDYSLSKNLFNKVLGIQFYKISYVSGTKNDGKPRYKDWDRIFLADATIDDIQNAWAQQSVYMTSYTPDVIDMIENQETSFNAEDFNQGSTEEEFEL
jgi:hypothetical protein